MSYTTEILITGPTLIDAKLLQATVLFRRLRTLADFFSFFGRPPLKQKCWSLPQPNPRSQTLPFHKGGRRFFRFATSSTDFLNMPDGDVTIFFSETEYLPLM